MENYNLKYKFLGGLIIMLCIEMNFEMDLRE